ncbi:Mitochondrial import inner membrane translocase subunit tim23 [Coemansia spiralis]|uniref:Mitochondrial import inner membrane translocase subunit tim23 n=2 Tax=Coemansia TaxID=4863 RepID=A0A9W8G8Z4_9FUNG|nr:Tim17/Tim22/Tim23/Pmp24 family-domain-containing protein [Coemansia spiralis]KAJ1995408.1 Mitochondrial import inner membrane translocase subunit tim23 [Coemansia umbellata]KAJ2624764.1 Mitochondrial import inner membrane translocase subunit tim23 [Coemansia sp. RSA 1358]KAJ2678307.1 Mitochondrial import inner membrane translocase subunit tim23 [Coemansia spiralis]
MSIFSVFSRNGQNPQDQQVQNDSTSSAAANSTEPAMDSAQPMQQLPSSLVLDQLQTGGVSDFLSQVDFASSQLNPVASPSGIEYLTIEDGPANAGGVVPSRGWSDDLCYGTGTMYILGLSTGGAWGFVEGVRSHHGHNFKLRLNSVLNSMTRRGPFVGNSLGVLAMFYNTINYVIGSYRGTRDQYNSIGAAAISGMLFKIGGGPRASIISGLICSGVVGTYHACITAYNSHKESSSVDIASLSSPSEPQLASTTSA